MFPKTLLDALRHVWNHLQLLNVPAAIMGGLANSAWENFRVTKDIDFLVALNEKDTERVVLELQKAGIRPKRDPAVLKFGDVELIQLLYEPPDSFVDIQIDLLVARSEYHQTALSRCVTAKLPGFETDIQIVSCEDLIVLKLIAGRIIDRADAAYVLRANRDTMDVAYLLSWCDKLNLNAELAEIWDEAFPGELPPKSE